MEITGGRGDDPYLPHLLGHEGAGVVLDIGDDVHKIKPGDRVVLTWIKGDGANVACSTYRCGEQTINAGAVTTFSHHALVSENRCVPIEESIPWEIASLMGCALPTGAGIVLNSMCPSTGDSMAIVGLGGIGMSALVGAKLCGCSPIIGIDTDPGKLELAHELGATDTLDASNDGLDAAVQSIVGTDGLDFAVEAAGSTETIEQAFGLVRDGGGLCVFAGHPPEGEKIRLDPHLLIRGKQIRGSWGGDTVPRRDIPMYARRFAEGSLPLEKLITHRFALEEINDAMATLRSGRAGRIVIDMGADEMTA